MGDFDIFIGYSFSLLFGLIIYNVINVFFFKNLLQRFGLFKLARKDFYECGFRPQTQKPVKMSVQFFMILIFFLLYDIELLFFFPFIAGMGVIGLFDLLVFNAFILLFLASMVIDYSKHALY